MPAGGSGLMSVYFGMKAQAQTPEEKQAVEDFKTAAFSGKPMPPDEGQLLVSSGLLSKNYGKTDLSGLKYMAAILGTAVGGALLLSALGPGAASTLPESVGEYAGGLDAASTAGVDAGTTALAGGGAAADTAATVPGYLADAVAADAPAAAGGSAGTLASLTDPAAAITGVDPTAGAATSMAVNTPYGPTLEQMGATPSQIASLTGGGSALSGVGHFLTSGLGSSLVGGGLGLLGSYLQSNAASNATAAQLQAAQQALALQAQMYNTNMGLNVGQFNAQTGLQNQQFNSQYGLQSQLNNARIQAYNATQSNLAPYRGAGNAAASLAGYYLGLPGYQQGNQQVLNAPPVQAPVAPVTFTPTTFTPLTTPPPISVPGLTPTGTPVPRNPAQQPAPQTTATSMGPAQVGEQRMVNGQLATWTGQGWEAA